MRKIKKSISHIPKHFKSNTLFAIFFTVLIVGFTGCQNNTSPNHEEKQQSEQELKGYGNWTPESYSNYYWSGINSKNSKIMKMRSLHTDTTDSAGWDIIKFSEPDSTWLEIQSDGQNNEFIVQYIDSTLNLDTFGQMLVDNGGFQIKTPFTDDSVYASIWKPREYRSIFNVRNRMICDSTYSFSNERVDVIFEIRKDFSPDSSYHLKRIYRFDAEGMHAAASAMMCD
ncbi:hypothetical protein [Fodinibius saliphilus]|uniref:hypothetical protein n=1 Tax=Fodinibius saliphilus TaxID=1920650 RepID=UPI00110997A5|nr:hypothetical protein [Fodinibius saliphilus]